ncbi:hypothetical protein ACFY12_34320 [Streptomyces sp. NPDC001339]|uniref:hypothetical protein n=1 Tax=Streptomyces sp. NPDC001339 TaxID=3364563 RepID=UPI0036A4CE53
MNRTKIRLPRWLRPDFTAPHWIELYAWLLAGLVVDLAVRSGGDGFDPGSVWHMGVGLLAIAAVRTGLLRWLAVFKRD